jgi:predicted nucleic acid-binding protein
MPAKAFFDTNVLIYAVAHDDPRTQAEGLLALGGVLSMQILNEIRLGGSPKNLNALE